MAGEHSRVDKVLVFGAGNVAYSMVPALQAVNGDSGVEVYSRSELSAAALGAAYGVEWHSGSWMPGGAYTVCVVAVPDVAVRASVERLEGDGRLVIHMSGSVPVVPLARGRSGVMYPLQSFAKGERSDLREVPLFVEGQDGASHDAIFALASKISCKVRTLSSAGRERLHLGGVVVNNFVYRLLALVQALGKGTGAIEVSDYETLLKTTMQRGLSADGGSRQTGPARRMDVETIGRQLRLVQKEFPRLLGPYVAMTESILSASKDEELSKWR
jgi:hypothetical protein